MPPIRLSLYEQHIENWKDCQRCELGQYRTKIVLARGKLPCDVLFIGEAPGESENIIGETFVGPAGHLLDRIIEDSIGGKEEERLVDGRVQRVVVGYRIAFTNLIACIPWNEEENKLDEPPDKSIKACGPRLDEFVGIVKPRLIVCVGKHAKQWLDSGNKHHVEIGWECPRVSITHPAAILRANIAQKGFLVQQCKVVLKNAVEEYL